MTTAVITRPVIKIGSKGSEVAKIQTALQNAGFSPGSIDSDFGLKTDQAVRYFQIDHHLKVDGIVGKDTWALLQKYSTPTQVQEYKVQPGDSLWEIAQKYHVSLDAIKKANPDIDEMNLQVGRVIKIPKAGEPVNTDPQVQEYKVQPGDSLWKIAQKYHVNLDAIKKANPDIHDPNNLQVGKVINIPNASVPEPSPEPKVPGGDNVEKVWGFFKSKGFSDEATAGIMGNLQQESEFNTRAVNKYSKATGLGQWLGVRLTKLRRWANDNGKNFYAIETQLEWIWKELNGEDSTTTSILNKLGGIEALKKMGINEAVVAFEKSFERSGGSHMSDRKKYAHEKYNRFANKSGVKRAMV